ncbi:MAG: DHA2 family efflux MFS transporter permease subunit [Streptosporangiaceae bacterium]
MFRRIERRWWALVAMALSLLVIGLDTTVLNVALPTVAVDLHASNSQLQWFADAYLLVMSALLLPAGLLGDKFGRKRLTVAALVVFGAGSLWCAFAGSPASLIGARVVLGVGAAVLVPLAMSTVVVLFEPAERGRAIGVVSIATILGLPAGPLIGGALLNHFWWGSVFLVNVPVIAVALLAAGLLLPKDGPAHGGRIDYVGVALSAVGLVGLTYGLIEGPVRGWTSLTVLGTVAVSLGLLVLFVRWESRVRSAEPVMDLALWRDASFRWGVVGATLASFGLFGVLFVLPQYFQSVSGVDALGTGVRTLPLMFGMIVGLQGGIRLGNRIGFARSAAFGFVGLVVGLLLGTRTGVHSGFLLIATWTAIAGLGMGMALVNAQNAALNTLSKARAGAGSAVVQAMRQVGSVTGIAALGAIVNGVYRSNVHTAGLSGDAAATVRDGVAGGVLTGSRLNSPALVESARQAFTSGLEAVLWVSGGVCLIAAVLVWLFLPRTGRPTAEVGDAGQSNGAVVEAQPASVG